MDQNQLAVQLANYVVNTPTGSYTLAEANALVNGLQQLKPVDAALPELAKAGPPAPKRKGNGKSAEAVT